MMDQLIQSTAFPVVLLSVDTYGGCLGGGSVNVKWWWGFREVSDRVRTAWVCVKIALEEEAESDAGGDCSPFSEILAGMSRGESK